MKNVCWNGCSFTVGEGFSESIRDSYIYDRLISKEFNFKSTNIAVSGSSNLEIFKRTAQIIYNNNFYDIIFVQWSALNRIWFRPGPDCCFFLNDERYPDFRYRDIYLNAPTKTKLKETLLLLNHDYHNILDLIDYCCAIECMAKTANVKVVFINGLVPWTKELSQPLDHSDLNKSLSDYTKFLLDFGTRDDPEIVAFFQQLQQKFSLLNKDLWVNLFESMHNNTLDTGPQGHHPGILSHRATADKISQYLIRNQYI